MIDISEIDDLTFTIRFDSQMAQELSDSADRGIVEDALTCALTDALLVANN